jgi:chromosomal replication initiation ATPase DnaA
MLAMAQVAPELFIGLPVPVQKRITQGNKLSEFDQIIERLLPYFNISRSQLFSRNRKANIVEARMIIVYLTLKTDNYTTTGLGKNFGMDHSSIVYYRITVNDRMKVDKQYRARVEQAESLLYSNY